MSIVDSREELDAARARLAEADELALIEDLRFWSVAEADAKHDHNQLAAEQAQVVSRYQEASHWSALIGEELRARRDARRLPGDHITD